MSTKTNALLEELRATYRARDRARDDYAALSPAIEAESLEGPREAWHAGNRHWDRMRAAERKAERILDELRRAIEEEAREPRPDLASRSTIDLAVEAVKRRLPVPPTRIRAEVVGTEDDIGGEPRVDVVAVTSQVLVRVPRDFPAGAVFG